MGTNESKAQRPTSKGTSGSAGAASLEAPRVTTSDYKLEKSGSGDSEAWANLSCRASSDTASSDSISTSEQEESDDCLPGPLPVGATESDVPVPPNIVSHPRDQKHIPRGTNVRLSIEVRTRSETIHHCYRWQRHPDCKRKVQRGQASWQAIQGCVDVLTGVITPEAIAPALYSKRIINVSAVEKAKCMVIGSQERAMELLLQVLKSVRAQPHLMDTVCGILESEGVSAVDTIKDEFRRLYKDDEGWQDLDDAAHIQGACSLELTIVGMEPSDEGSYRCIATNEGGQAVSEIATLTLIKETDDVKAPREHAIEDEHGAMCSYSDEECESFVAGHMDEPTASSLPPPQPVPEQSLESPGLESPGLKSPGLELPQPVLEEHKKLSPILERSQSAVSPCSIVSSHDASESQLPANDHPHLTITDILQELEAAAADDDDVAKCIVDKCAGCCKECKRVLMVKLIRMKKRAPGVLEMALKKGFPLDYRDENEKNLLHISCECFNVEAVHQLIRSQQIDLNAVDKSGNTALHVALLKLQQVPMWSKKKADAECSKIVEDLIENGAKAVTENSVGEKPLHLACQCGSPQLLEVLLPRSAKCLNARTKEFDTPLHLACRNGFTEAVQPLLERGADRDAQNNEGKTPLHLACLEKNASIVSQLTAESSSKAVEIADYGLNTPLHLACMGGNGTVVKLLLRTKRCQVKARNKENDNTALHIACDRNHFDIVSQLIREDDSLGFVNAANRQFDTALHIACRNGSLKIVKYLKDHRASNSFVNEHNERPLDIARKCHHEDIVHFLEGRGKIIPWKHSASASKQRHITY